MVGYLNATTTFSGQLGVSGNNMANFGLTKVGTGTLMLTGTNIYTGQTTVSNGELVISTVFAGNGNFAVANQTALGVTNLSTSSALVSSLAAAAGATLEFQNVSNLTAALISAANFTSAVVAVKITCSERRSGRWQFLSADQVCRDIERCVHQPAIADAVWLARYAREQQKCRLRSRAWRSFPPRCS